MQDTGEREAAEATYHPPPPKSQVRGVPATDWRQERCAAHSEQAALAPSSLTHQSRATERERERRGGGNCGDVRKERGREPGRENKQDRGCSVCQVSGEFENVLHRCSPERKTPGGLSAPGAVIYHQSGGAGATYLANTVDA